VPARLFCERCFVQLGDEAWTAVGPGGELVSYTVLRVGIDGAPTPPRALGLAAWTAPTPCCPTSSAR
jgi:uncharacterized OB-fold protein